jgi:hypothetical protein
MNLDGYKTYIVAALILVAGIARSRGWIDEATFQLILVILGAGGLAALRAGVKK